MTPPPPPPHPSSSPSSPNMNNPPSDSHLRVSVDDVPPPPYSETDIYSSGTRSPHSISGPAVAVTVDDAASSTTGDAIIYTPPLTPRTSSNSNSFAVPPSHSANLYFNDHPAAVPVVNGETLVHNVVLNQASKPDDLPYPADWAATHDVTHADWSTFVNFLIPHHDMERNEAIIGEKVRSIDVENIRAGSNTPTDLISEKSGPGPAGDPLEAMRRRAEVEATVRQWNDGFFAPRGVRVELQSGDTTGQARRIPGAWDATFDRSTNTAIASGTAVPGPSTEREADAPQQQQQQQQQQAEEARQHILNQILQPEAQERLGRIRLVKEERANDVENRLIMLAQSGQLQSKVTEAQLKDLLNAMAEKHEEEKIVVSRRKAWDDDDDDLLGL